VLEKFHIKNDDIFPVCVMATMSSGKSTFINSILGEEILPERNEACTAHAIAVLNDENADGKRAYIVRKNGDRGYATIDHRSVMERVNADEDIDAVLIRAKIPGIWNWSRPVVLFDTPGVNNSQDIRHAERTQNILEHLDHGVIVYLMNATQLATNDDALLLEMVSSHLKKYPDLKICFVLNKIDMLDEDKENVADIVSDAEKYIEDFGLKDSMIFPLSAKSAKILRLKLSEKYMTSNERHLLADAYEEYQAVEKTMLRYSSVYSQSDKEFMIGDRVISEYELKRAIENTGITEIERQIEKFVFEREHDSIQQVMDTDHYAAWETVYSDSLRARNFKNFRGIARWICKHCRQINGDNKCCLYCGKENVNWRLV